MPDILLPLFVDTTLPPSDLDELGLSMETEHTWESLERALDDACDARPKGRYTIGFDYDGGGGESRALKGFAQGKVFGFDVLLSLRRDRLLRTPARRRPGIEVVGDPAQLLAVLGPQATQHAGTVYLPESFQSLQTLSHSARALAFGMRARQARFSALVAGLNYEVTLKKKASASIRPLYWAVANLAAHERWGDRFQSAEPLPRFDFGEPLPAAPADEFPAFVDPHAPDPEASYTSGAIGRRIYALQWADRELEKLPAYLAALDHPANASVEAEAVRARLYAVLSKSDAPEARERLRRGFRAETDYVSRCIAEILHRQPSVVAGIVRDDLVRSFRNDPAYSQRILQFLRDEYVRVKREWVKGAPRELVAQLAPLLDRND